MQRLPLIAVMAALVGAVIGGALVFSGGGRNGLPPVSSPTIPSAAPAASASSAAASSAVSDEIPAALQYRWIGQPRDIPGVGSSTRTALNFRTAAFGMTGTAWGFTPTMLGSEADMPEPGTINLWTASAGLAGGCQPGDAGKYAYTLSPGGTQLHITAVGTDGCAARQVGVVGDWNRVNCTNTDSGCWGELEAGTHQTQYVDPNVEPGESWEPRLGAVEFTVPDGWANSVDWPTWFALTPQANYATEGPNGHSDGSLHEVDLYAMPAAAVGGASCDRTLKAGVARTVNGLIGYLQGLPALTTSKTATPITIDGHAGKWLDVSLAPAHTASCPGDSLPGTVMFAPADGSENWTLGLFDQERERLIFLDLGGGDVLVISIDSTDPARFDELVAQATPIIESMTFH
jgi:hypothetical protein